MTIDEWLYVLWVVLLGVLLLVMAVRWVIEKIRLHRHPADRGVRLPTDTE